MSVHQLPRRPLWAAAVPSQDLDLCEDLSRRQQVAEANPTKKLGADTARDGIDHLRAILRRVNVHPERSLAKGGIDYLDDGVRDCRDIRIGRHDGDEPFEYLVRETRIGAGVVFSSPCLVGGRPSAAFAAKYGAR